ncbi:MAG: TIGR03792 family protein [Acidimicrobiales bacterium]
MDASSPGSSERSAPADRPGLSGPRPYRYQRGERLPVEVLVFRMDPAHVEEYLALDHEIWTLGEALLDGFDHIPFLSKEVWLDDSKPGEVTLVFVWESLDAWLQVGAEDIQRALQARFDERFGHPIELIAAPHEESNFGIHRWSRFERITP